MKTTFMIERLFDGRQWHYNSVMTVENGKILGFGEEPGSTPVKLLGTVVPGFIDVQVNGGGGVLFNHAPSLETLRLMLRAHAKFGVTAMLPTVITSNCSTLNQASDAVAQAIAAKEPGILGIHFEGPHISQAKKGIHSADLIRDISAEEWLVYQRQDLGIKVITVAPETVSNSSITRLVEAGLIVCLGHTNAPYEHVKEALAAGATGFTHLFNAMSALTSRTPGAVGAALDNAGACCGLILDGLHVHPAAARIAQKIKPRGKLFLVTDAMSTIGSDQRSFELDGRTIRLSGNQLADNDGTLAGSALDMITAVNNAVTLLHLDTDEAVRMASLYPAQFLGVSQQSGQLMVGSDANFVQLQSEPGHFKVLQSWYQGIPLIEE